MGKIKYIENIEKFIQKTPVFDISSLKKFILIKKGNRKYIYLLVNKLLKKGKIKRLTKGYYTIYEEPSLAVLSFKPAYLGLQDALSFHNLWEQETIPIIITTKKIKVGIRKFLNTNILLRRINKKYFFGFDYYKQNNFYLPYSDIEKTLIDLIYFKEKLSLEEMANIKNKINFKKLNSYLKIYPKKFREKIMRKLDIKF